MCQDCARQRTHGRKQGRRDPRPQSAGGKQVKKRLREFLTVTRAKTEIKERCDRQGCRVTLNRVTKNHLGQGYI